MSEQEKITCLLNLGEICPKPCLLWDKAKGGVENLSSGEKTDVETLVKSCDIEQMRPMREHLREQGRIAALRNTRPPGPGSFWTHGPRISAFEPGGTYGLPSNRPFVPPGDID